MKKPVPNLFQSIGLLSVVLVCVFLAGNKGCPFSKEGFPHKVHMEEADMACTDCHKSAKTAEKASMPTAETCTDCHELEDKELKKLTMLLKEKEVPWPSKQFLYGDELIFSHETHAEFEVDCKECHQGVEKSSQITRDHLPKMALCVACHQKNGADNACATCHKEIREGVKPKDHHLGWEWTHGQKVKQNGFANEEANCSYCHTQSSCTQCHQKEPPRNHNHYWRLRGHAIDASVDRTDCATCHQTNFCIRCHQENAPVSHLGGWGPPTNMHCIGCHAGSTEASCNTCHQGGAQHQMFAPRLPIVVPAHFNSNTCLNCHSVGPNAVRHPTNGGDGGYCRSCHQ